MPERTGGVRQNVSVTLLLQWIKYAINLVSLVILARLLQPTDYGLVAEATVIIGLASVVGDLGLSLAAVQAPTLSQDQRSALFWVNGALGFITGLVIAACSPLMAAFYREPRLVPVTLALASVFLVSGFSVQWKVDINRAGRFWSLGLIDVLSGAIGLAVAVVAASLGFGFWALVGQQVVAALVGLVLAANYSRWRPSPPRRKSNVTGLLRFGRDTFAVHLGNYVTSNIDSVLIGRFFGTAVLGLYNRAFQVVVLPLDQVLAPLTRVLLPRFAKLTSDDDLNQALVRVQQLIAYLIVGALSLLAATSTSVLTVVLGDQWTAAGKFVQILTVGAAFQALGYVYYWAFLARSRTALLFVSELWGRVPMAALMVFLVQFGPDWVAISMAVGQFLIFLAGSTYYAARIGVRVRPLLAAAVRPIAVFTCAIAVSRVVDTATGLSPGLVSLTIEIGSWLAIVGVALMVIPRCRSDLRSILIDMPTRRLRVKSV